MHVFSSRGLFDAGYISFFVVLNLILTLFCQDIEEQMDSRNKSFFHGRSSQPIVLADGAGGVSLGIWFKLMFTMSNSIYHPHPHPPPPPPPSRQTNFSYRNKTYEKYSVGINSKYLNLRNIEFFPKFFPFIIYTPPPHPLQPTKYLTQARALGKGGGRFIEGYLMQVIFHFS